MKNNLLIYIIVIAAVLVSSWALFTKSPTSGLASPFAALTSQPSPTPSPSPSPIQYSFDKSTDLKAQLNSVQPEIKDSDFNEIKKLSSQL